MVRTNALQPTNQQHKQINEISSQVIYVHFILNFQTKLAKFLSNNLPSTVTVIWTFRYETKTLSLLCFVFMWLPISIIY